MWSYEGVLGSFEKIYEMGGVKVKNEVISVSDVKDKKPFAEKMEQIIDSQKSDDSIPNSKEFYEQIMNLAMDLYDCIQEFQENMLETYDEPILKRQEMNRKTVNAKDYGSGDYSFERLSKAKLACKAALQRMCKDAESETESIKKAQLDEVEQNVQKWLDEIGKSVEDFIDEFQESFADYIELYCSGEAKTLADNVRNHSLSKKSLLKLWNAFDLRGKVETLVQEEYGLDTSSSVDPQSYFELCTYNQGKNGMYCYYMEAVAERLNETDEMSLVRQDLNKQMGNFVNAMRAVYNGREKKTDLTELQHVCSDFVVKMKQMLISMIIWEDSK